MKLHWFLHNSPLRRSRYWSALAMTGVGAMAAAQPAHADTTAEWLTTSGGNWTTAADWSTSTNYPNNGTPAGSAYQALIDMAGTGAYTVSLANAVSVDAVTLNTSNATLSQTAGTLTAPIVNLEAGTYKLSGGTLSGGSGGGTLSITSGAGFNWTGGTLDHLTISGGNLSVAHTPTALHINDGLSMSGNALTIGSANALYFDGVSQTIDNLTLNTSSDQLYVGGTASSGGVTLTLGTHAVVSGSENFYSYNNITSEALINNGSIQTSGSTSAANIAIANFTNNGSLTGTSSSSITINSANWSNSASATISVNDSKLALSGTWSNVGTISATNGSTVSLGGSFSVASAQSISASSDSAVTVTGDITGSLGTSSPTLNFSNAAQACTLKGATITSAKIDFTNDVKIQSATLSGAEIINGGSVSVPTGGTLSMAGSWSNLGTIDVAANATLNLGGTFSSAAIGSIVSSSTVILDGTLNNAGSTFSPSFPVTVDSRGAINGGTLATSFVLGLGTLTSVTIAPGVTITSTDGIMSGSWVNQGVINLPTGGGISLYGSFTIASMGTINQANGSTVLFAGTLNNMGTTLTTSYPWELMGTISGGSIASDETIFGHPYFTNTNIDAAVTLSGEGNAAFSGTWTNAGAISTDNSSPTFDGTWNNTGTITTNNTAAGTNWFTYFNGNWTNSGTLVFGDYAIGTFEGTWSNTGTITLGNRANLSIWGNTTLGQLGTLAASSTATLNLEGNLIMEPREVFTTDAMIELNNGAQIIGGTVDLAADQTLSIYLSGGFDGVSIIGGNLKTINSYNIIGSMVAVTISGGLDLGGDIFDLYGPAQVQCNGTQTLSNGTFVVPANAGTTTLITTGALTLAANTTFIATSAGAPVALALSGAGSISNDGAVETNGLYAVLQVSTATFINNGSVSVLSGDCAFMSGDALTNNGVMSDSSSSSTLDLQTSTWINSPGATISASNGATLYFRGGGANNGTIFLGSGATANLSGSQFTNKGTIQLAGGTINAASGLAVGDGILAGSGTINGNVTLNSDPSQLFFNIGGTMPDTGYDSLIINGNLAAAGDLEINIINGFQYSITPAETFTVLSLTGSFTGSFENIADGQRLATADGSGSFEVDYGTGAYANEIVLSNFVLVPEPSLALLPAGLIGAALLRRTRQPTHPS